MKDGRGGKWANAALQKGYSHHNDCMPHKEYVRWQRQCLKQMFRVLKEDGAIFYNHKWRVQGGLLVHINGTAMASCFSQDVGREVKGLGKRYSTSKTYPTFPYRDFSKYGC
jgi:DNA modification methylase